MPDPVAVNSLFGRIAGRYDLANRVLSLGMDAGWRRRLVREVSARSPRHVVDLATGSGDVAFALARKLPPTATIEGLDFCQPMLDVAERRKAEAGTTFGRVTFRLGDAHALPLPDASADVVTVAFGLRNMASRDGALREMRRLLRPGGVLCVLEFSQPNPAFRPFYFFYMKHVAPRLAGALTGDRAAYEYLCTSIEAFPGPAELSEEIRRAGFGRVGVRRFTLGTVALHVAET